MNDIEDCFKTSQLHKLQKRKQLRQCYTLFFILPKEEILNHRKEKRTIAYLRYRIHVRGILRVVITFIMV